MELMSKTGEKSGPYVACIKLSLNKALDDSTVNYSLHYAGTEITDTVGNPLETFDRSLMTVSDGIKMHILHRMVNMFHLRFLFISGCLIQRIRKSETILAYM